MNKNLVVIEVKPAILREEGLNKDFLTLNKFTRNAGYYKAIYLIYGNNQHTIDRIINRVEQETPGFSKGSFVLLWHQQPLTPAKIIFQV